MPSIPRLHLFAGDILVSPDGKSFLVYLEGLFATDSRSLRPTNRVPDATWIIGPWTPPRQPE
jgi:hypothetical protein